MRFIHFLLTPTLMLSGCGRAADYSPPAAAPVPVPTPAAAPGPTPQSAPAKRHDWAAGTPESTVETFYNEYLRQRSFHDRTYRHSAYLGPEMIRYLDKRIADAEKDGGGGSDPFLCAQSIPLEVIADKAEIIDGKAIVSAYSGPWEGGTKWMKLSIQLGQRDAQWQIDNITCPAR